MSTLLDQSQVRTLPRVAFPSCNDKNAHGLQKESLSRCKDVIPMFDLSGSFPLRNPQLCIKQWAALSREQVVEALAVIGEAFERNEPVMRHVILPQAPSDFHTLRHSDGLQKDTEAGPWSAANLTAWWARLYWVVDLRLPGAPLIRETMESSLAVVSPDGHVTTAICVSVQAPFDGNDFERDKLCPIGQYVTNCYSFLDDICEEADNHGLAELCRQFPDFENAIRGKKVAEACMLGKGNHASDSREPFELLYRLFFHLQTLGYSYMYVLASAHWTGAFLEMAGAVRVYFCPWQGKRPLPVGVTPQPSQPCSPNGWMSDKDSGLMMYVVRLSP